jgi:hypothetical protein
MGELEFTVCGATISSTLSTGLIGRDNFTPVFFAFLFADQ